MKTRHDQSPDISEDDYNKFSDPEKKESKIHEKNQIQKSVAQLQHFPKKTNLWYDQISFVKSLEIRKNSTKTHVSKIL